MIDFYRTGQYLVITTESTGDMTTVHHRMPLILTTSYALKYWLDVGTKWEKDMDAFVLQQRDALRLRLLNVSELSCIPSSPRETLFPEPDFEKV
jgi:putative SOS response-associated peptidase YedK